LSDVEGLEEDTEDILEYFGEDFINSKKKKNPATFGYGTGYSHGVISPNYLLPPRFLMERETRFESYQFTVYRTHKTNYLK